MGALTVLEDYHDEVVKIVFISPAIFRGGEFWKRFKFGFLRKFFLRVLYPIIFVVLRRLVSSKKFWWNGLSLAFENLKEDTVETYRRPSTVVGWEKELIRFLGRR